VVAINDSEAAFKRKVRLSGQREKQFRWLERRTRNEAEKDHTGASRNPACKDQFAKITVECDEQAIFPMSLR
jgi:hypothetical protein